MRISRSSSRSLALVALVALLGAAPAASARSHQGDAFRRHVDRALALYRAQDYAAAIQSFQRAYELRQLPRLLLNMGQAHRKLGHAREALACYRLYLRAEPAPPPEVKADLERYIAQTQALLEATVRLQPEPPPSEPAVSPPPALTPVLPAPRPSPSAAPTVTKAAPRAALVTLPTKPPPAPPPLYRRWWFWTTLGVAAGAAAGVTAGVLLSQPSAPAGIDIRDVRF